MPRHSSEGPKPREIARLTQRVGDQLQRPAVLLDDLAVQSREVEAVKDVVLVDLGKVLVALSGEEPGDPRVGVLRVGLGGRDEDRSDSEA